MCTTTPRSSLKERNFYHMRRTRVGSGQVARNQEKTKRHGWQFIPNLWASQIIAAGMQSKTTRAQERHLLVSLNMGHLQRHTLQFCTSHIVRQAKPKKCRCFSTCNTTCLASNATYTGHEIPIRLLPVYKITLPAHINEIEESPDHTDSALAEANARKIIAWRTLTSPLCAPNAPSFAVCTAIWLALAIPWLSASLFTTPASRREADPSGEHATLLN